MGYTNKNEHDALLLNVKQSLNQLHTEFPKLRNMENDERVVFEEALKIVIDEMVITAYNSKDIAFMSNCEAELDYCQGIALSAYLYATSVCLTSVTLGPFVALGCQIGVSVLHAAAQYDCQKQYSQCVE